MKRPGRTVPASLLHYQAGRTTRRSDVLAAEEPLEIRIASDGKIHSIAVTMRTPGDDFDLAVGFLYSEGIIHHAQDIAAISYCVDKDEAQRYNIVQVSLAEQIAFTAQQFSRHVYTSSACGVCGKTSLEMVHSRCEAIPAGNVRLEPTTLLQLPAKLRHKQQLFSTTGGLHATALCDLQGEILALREDIGRHNAMDKMIGRLIMEQSLPATNTIALLSGRASFELIQKAAIAGIAVVAAIGAPSSLAVELAKSYKMTLIGFLRHDSFNVYSGIDRIVSPEDGG